MALHAVSCSRTKIVLMDRSMAFSYNGGLLIGLGNFLLFAFIGMNSILLYVGHGILWRHLPFSWEMDKYGGHGEMLAMNITGTALWCLIAYYLFTKNVFLKV